MNSSRNISLLFIFSSQKATTDCCAAAQLHEILQLRFYAKKSLNNNWSSRYGEDDGTVNWAQYGLPDNKYIFKLSLVSFNFGALDLILQLLFFLAQSKT